MAALAILCERYDLALIPIDPSFFRHDVGSFESPFFLVRDQHPDDRDDAHSEHEHVEVLPTPWMKSANAVVHGHAL